ncbi:MAG: hypothetical protein V1744_02650 [Candidatus Altiarchaeota archaeon]
MPEYDSLEREAVDYFRRDHMRVAQEQANEGIRRLVLKHKYGSPQVHAPMMMINWDKVFEENQCPSCRDFITLRDMAYYCSKCKLTIPLELHDKAEQEHTHGKEMLAEYWKLIEKLEKAGYTEERVQNLYEAGTMEAVAELEKKKREMEVNEEAERQAAEDKRGASLTRRRADEKR